MLECKICGKSLYNKISFTNMFKMDYEIHQECIEKLVLNNEEDVIPIESNIIIYDYVFNEYNNDFNEEYLWSNHFGRILEKHLFSKEWSIILIYDDSVMNLIVNYNPYLLLNLTSNPILFISLKEKNMSCLEGL